MNEKKVKIVAHYKESIEWVKGFIHLSEEQWRTPIAEGKWTIAEIIGHLIPWDELVLKNRIPYLISETAFPVSPDAEQINKHAALRSRERTKEIVIDEFCAGRRNLITSLNFIEDDLWIREFAINETILTLSTYLWGLIEHDEHHFKQIQRIIG